MLYHYLASDNQGKIYEGNYDAENINDVLVYLSGSGLKPISIKAIKIIKPLIFSQSIKLSDKIFLMKYLSLMLQVGTDLLSAINILISDLQGSGIHNFLIEVRENLTKGRPFYEAFAKHPRSFSIVETNIIKAAEASGNLQKTFEDLSESLQREAEIRGKIRSALIYPIILLIMSLAIFFFLSTFALPKIAKVFNESGIEPPTFSRIVFTIGLFISDHFAIILFLLLIIISFLIYFFGFNNFGKTLIRQFISRLPFVKKIYLDIAIQRFTSTFSSLLKAGIPIIDSLKITADVVGHQEIKLALLRIAEEGLSRGLTVSESFKKEIIFPRVVTNLIAISEKAGHLDEVLGTLAKFYASNIDSTIKSVVAVIEPILLILMGGLVGIIALSIVIPIYQLAMKF
ncbi:MAG: type II secretion system F family protein [Patescibacteria group bacterium]|nr:type II secretion system F family protein [Patescibacteria group bacterium]MDW8279794.1 type II secretion system F family protein [bacterium]